MRIAIADASPFMQQWISAAVGGLSAAPVLVATGLDLLYQIAERGPFDVVVADGRLPGLSAAQVLAMARTAGDMTPFLLLSPVADASLLSLVKKMKAAAILHDPLDANALVEATRMVAGVERARRSGTRSWRPWRPSIRLLARALGRPAAGNVGG
jgi:DNA-binding NarL/FixJ family response regulator